MKVTAYKTSIVTRGNNLQKILDRHLPKLEENSIVVITSKIVSICQGRVVKHDDTVDKDTLIEQEAEWYISEGRSRYGVTLTVKEGIMIANSGIDESNGNGSLVLWPDDPMKVALDVWQHLREKNGTKKLGVIITDTRHTPLRWGTIGVGIAWCGFEPLKNYIGTPDIYGKKLRITKESIIDGLAAAADVVIGQGDEQTPLAIISDAPFVEFTDRPPTKEEIDALHIDMKDDLYAPVLTSAKWKKGGRSQI